MDRRAQLRRLALGLETELRRREQQHRHDDRRGDPVVQAALHVERTSQSHGDPLVVDHLGAQRGVGGRQLQVPRTVVSTPSRARASTGNTMRAVGSTRAMAHRHLGSSGPRPRSWSWRRAEPVRRSGIGPASEPPDSSVTPPGPSPVGSQPQRSWARGHAHSSLGRNPFHVREHGSEPPVALPLVWHTIASVAPALTPLPRPCPRPPTGKAVLDLTREELRAAVVQRGHGRHRRTTTS
jgi:hypothetical protein